MGTESPDEGLPPETQIPVDKEPQPPPRPRFSRRRLTMAFTVAALADGLAVFFNVHAAGTVGSRFGDSHLAVHGAGPAMDLAARPDHGGDPRPLHLPCLGACGCGCGNVGGRAAKN